MFNKKSADITTRLIAMLLLLCLPFSYICVFASENDGTIPETHTVSAGETLGSIAKKYDVTVDELCELNEIQNRNIIRVNMVLKIPGGYIAQEEPPVENTAPKPPEVDAAAVGQNNGDSSSTYGGMITDMYTKISVRFRNADIRDVLSAFAVNIGYNFIYKGSSANVTLELDDVTIGEALEYVMKLVNMTYITDGRTIIVGEKNDLIYSFSDALQLTEFVLSYVKAEIVMSQISTLAIPVTAALSGGNEYRFIAQGLPADLSKVRDLILMIDKKENTMLGTAGVTSYFYTVELAHLTAAEFQTILSAAELPRGVILAAKPKTLYVYASAANYKSITEIQEIVDTPHPEIPILAEDKPTIKQIDLNYVTLDLIESQITGNAAVKVIKISTNKSTLWLSGLPAQIRIAEEIIGLLDDEKNILATSEELKAQFRAIKLKYITAQQFNATLSSLGLPTGISFPENVYTLFMSATDNQMLMINDVLNVVDMPDNKSADSDTSPDVTMKVSLLNVSKEFAIPFINALGLNVTVIDIENMQKQIWLKGPENDVMKALSSISTIDTQSANIVFSYRNFMLYNISASEMKSKLDALGLSNVSVYTGTLAGFSSNVLVSFPNDMERTIAQIIASLDVPTDFVTLMVDSIEFTVDFGKTEVEKDEDGNPIGTPGAELSDSEKSLIIHAAIEKAMEKLHTRIELISKMTNIPKSKFEISDNISKTNSYRYILYLKNATLAEVKLARDVVSELG